MVRASGGESIGCESKRASEPAKAAVKWLLTRRVALEQRRPPSIPRAESFELDVALRAEPCCLSHANSSCDFAKGHTKSSGMRIERQSETKCFLPSCALSPFQGTSNICRTCFLSGGGLQCAYIHCCPWPAFEFLGHLRISDFEGEGL